MHDHTFEIEPGRGIGPVRFGMSKEEVSRLFTYVYRSFFKTADAPHRSDQIEVVGLIVHYDASGAVEYIEAIPRPKYSSVRLILFGEDVTGASVAHVVEIVGSHSATKTRETKGYAFPEIGLSTYNDVFRSDEDEVEAFGLEQLPH